MSGSRWVRQSHRWVSIVFTVTVIANFVAMGIAPGEPPPWITYAPLPPLFVQLATGLYLFVLPYTGRLGGKPRGAAGTRAYANAHVAAGMLHPGRWHGSAVGTRLGWCAVRNIWSSAWSGWRCSPPRSWPPW